VLDGNGKFSVEEVDKIKRRFTGKPEQTWLVCCAEPGVEGYNEDHFFSCRDDAEEFYEYTKTVKWGDEVGEEEFVAQGFKYVRACWGRMLEGNDDTIDEWKRDPEPKPEEAKKAWKFSEFRPAQLDTVLFKLPFGVLVKIFNQFKDKMTKKTCYYSNGQQARLTKNARISFLIQYGKENPDDNIECVGESNLTEFITEIVKRQFYRHMELFRMEIH
jgi:hypothetical protein